MYIYVHIYIYVYWLWDLSNCFYQVKLGVLRFQAFDLHMIRSVSDPFWSAVTSCWDSSGA